MSAAAVRLATSGDAGTVADLQLDLWRDAYCEMLPGSVLLSDRTAHTELWRSRIDSAGPVLLAWEGRFAVGFASIDAADLGTGRGEVETLGVLPRWSRRGHGGRLLAFAAEQFRRAGLIGAYWWALEDDQTIAGFLAGAGWQPQERRGLDTGERVLTEIRYTGTIDLIAL